MNTRSGEYENLSNFIKNTKEEKKSKGKSKKTKKKEPIKIDVIQTADIYIHVQ